MNKRRMIVPAIVLITLSVVTGSEAQQKENVSSKASLALEVTFYKGMAPTYQPVPEQESSPSKTWYGRFRRIASWQGPEGSLPVRGVNIVTRRESDAIKINVSVFMGNQTFDKEEPVATYLVRENERIVIAELTRFGVQPFEIGVIRKAKVIPDLLPVKNDTQSIQVIGLEPKDSTLPFYSLSLKNISSKNITAMEIFVFVGNERRIGSQPQGKEGKPLIEAGAVFKTDLRGAEDAVKTPQGYVPSSPRDQSIVIGTVIFDDGTYEGDVRVVAEFKARRLGHKLQLAQVSALLRNAVEARDADSLTAVESLKRQISSMKYEENTFALSEVLKDFPDVDRGLESQLQLIIQSGQAYIKKILLDEIESLEANLKKAPDKNAIQNWLNATSAKYEQWLSRL